MAEKIYFIADKDNSGKIDFYEFMMYTFMIIEGTQDQKIDFVFNMISNGKETFQKNDLTTFYSLIEEENLIKYPSLKKQRDQEL